MPVKELLALEVHAKKTIRTQNTTDPKGNQKLLTKSSLQKELEEKALNQHQYRLEIRALWLMQLFELLLKIFFNMQGQMGTGINRRSSNTLISLETSPEYKY